MLRKEVTVTSPTRRQQRPIQSHKIPAHSSCNQPFAGCQHWLPSAFESLAVPSSDEPASNKKEGQQETELSILRCWRSRGDYLDVVLGQKLVGNGLLLISKLTQWFALGSRSQFLLFVLQRIKILKQTLFKHFKNGTSNVLHLPWCYKLWYKSLSLQVLSGSLFPRKAKPQRNSYSSGAIIPRRHTNMPKHYRGKMLHSGTSAIALHQQCWRDEHESQGTNCGLLI